MASLISVSLQIMNIQQVFYCLGIDEAQYNLFVSFLVPYFSLCFFFALVLLFFNPTEWPFAHLTNKSTSVQARSFYSFVFIIRVCYFFATASPQKFASHECWVLLQPQYHSVQCVHFASSCRFKRVRAVCACIWSGLYCKWLAYLRQLNFKQANENQEKCVQHKCAQIFSSV